jgi:hypothetical protein
MEVVDQKNDAVVLRLTNDELIAFSNALNESLGWATMGGWG